ncbi:hypothetical protein V6N13_010990 [Hibiscus sabdariffa]
MCTHEQRPSVGKTKQKPKSNMSRKKIYWSQLASKDLSFLLFSYDFSASKQKPRAVPVGGAEGKTKRKKEPIKGETKGYSHVAANTVPSQDFIHGCA